MPCWSARQRVLDLERRLDERRIEIEQLINVVEIDDRDFVRKVLLIHVAAAFQTLAASRVFNQNPAHCFCCGSENMSTAILAHRFVCHQSDVRLMDKGGSVQGVTTPLASQAAMSHKLKILVDERQKIVNSRPVTPGKPT